MEARTLTRTDIQRLQVGDRLIWTMDTRHGLPVEGARWSEPMKVVEVYAAGVSNHGKAYVCFYTQSGERSRISGSICEGEECYRLVVEETLAVEAGKV
jgi:hypothetical protein